MSEFPTVTVVVTIISVRGKLLMVWNPRWGAFTLPMTKPRRWQEPKGERFEAPADAAARNVAECLGITISQPLAHLDWPVEYNGFEQSDADGAWKRYAFEVFECRLDEIPALAPGRAGQWLTGDEILDEDRRPISPTARKLISRLRAEAALK